VFDKKKYYMIFSAYRMSIKTEIGRQVSSFRRKRGLRIHDLAQRTGKNPARISELENGKSNSTVDFLNEIGAALGLTLMFVPNDRLADVQAIIGIRDRQIAPAYDLPTVFDEVFIDDSETGEEGLDADR
jgi:transcriptional regulator with XRE-family HTH domain